MDCWPFQGVAELVRCVMAMRTGIWPERLADVKETEDLLADADMADIAAILPTVNEPWALLER